MQAKGMLAHQNSQNTEYSLAFEQEFIALVRQNDSVRATIERNLCSQRFTPFEPRVLLAADLSSAAVGNQIAKLLLKATSGPIATRWMHLSQARTLTKEMDSLLLLFMEILVCQHCSWDENLRVVHMMCRQRISGMTSQHENQDLAAWCAILEAGFLDRDGKCDEARTYLQHTKATIGHPKLVSITQRVTINNGAVELDLLDTLLSFRRTLFEEAWTGCETTLNLSQKFAGKSLRTCRHSIDVIAAISRLLYLQEWPTPRKLTPSIHALILSDNIEGDLSSGDHRAIFNFITRCILTAVTTVPSITVWRESRVFHIADMLPSIHHPGVISFFTALIDLYNMIMVQREAGLPLNTASLVCNVLTITADFDPFVWVGPVLAVL